MDLSKTISLSGTVASTVDDNFSVNTYVGTGLSQVIETGISSASTEAWWAKKIYAASTTIINKLAVDTFNNLYLTGYYNSNPDYAFIVKFNSVGVVQWQRKAQEDTSRGVDIAIDASGNAHLIGYADDGSKYLFIAKYNSSGVIQWQRKLQQGVSNTFGYAIAVDTSANVYVTGYASDGSVFAPLVKYNSSGVIQWQRKLYGDALYGHALVTDTSDNIYIVGEATTGTDYGYIAKYNSSGVIQWQRKLQQDNTTCRAAAIDTSANVYITGQAYDSANYAFIAKYNSSGAIQWQRKIREGASVGYGISVDASANVYIIGGASDGSSYAFIAKYNSSGAIQWQRRFCENSSTGYDSAVDTLGNVYATSSASDGSQYGALIKLLADGTTTSGEAFVTLSGGGVTDSAGGLTEEAGAISEDVNTLTDSVGGLTDSEESLTIETAQQRTVTDYGLIWIKNQDAEDGHRIFDTERGVAYYMESNDTTASTEDVDTLTAFTVSGFVLGADVTINTNAENYVAWSFRKASRFFDIVTYTGTGIVGKEVPHDLRVTPGMIIVKQLSAGTSWYVYHRSLGVTKAAKLELTSVPIASIAPWNNTEPTDLVFTVDGHDGEVSADVNNFGETYIAYVFAHDTEDDGMIQCGTFTTDGSGLTSVTLGWQPQYLLVRNIDAIENWKVYDTERGVASGAADAVLYPNTVDDEEAPTDITLTVDGFDINALTVSDDYIYMAIRKEET